MNQPETITMQIVTANVAEEKFPGCITEDIKCLINDGPITDSEPDYLRLVIFQDQLYAVVYEIFYLGWSVFHNGVWRDLDNIDNALSVRFHGANFNFIH